MRRVPPAEPSTPAPRAPDADERQIASGTGALRWFSEVMGFGFIGPDEGSGDLFVEMSALRQACPGEVRLGDRFAYEVAPERRLGHACAARLRALPRQD